MATNDYSMSLNDKKKLISDSASSNKYSNLNLNQNVDSHNDITFGSNNNTGVSKKSCDFAKDDNSPSKRGTHSWNKTSKDLSSNLVNNDYGSKIDDGLNKGQNSKVKNNSSSTLSLHIKAYENSVEVSASDSCIREGLKKKSLFDKQFFVDSTSVIQNPFEFPRQQNDDVPEPEASTFRATQRVLNPNAAAKMCRQCLSYAPVPVWFPQAASYGIMALGLIIVFICYKRQQDRLEKTYYDIIDEMDEEQKEREETELMGGHKDGTIKVIKTMEGIYSASPRTNIKVMMVKNRVKSKKLPSSSQTSSPSSISPLFLHDCTFRIVFDLLGIDAIALSDSLKYLIISKSNEISPDSNQLTKNAASEIGEYIINATKSRLEEITKNFQMIGYGVIKSDNKWIMAGNESEDFSMLSKVLEIEFQQPLEIVLSFYRASSPATAEATTPPSN